MCLGRVAYLRSRRNDASACAGVGQVSGEILALHITDNQRVQQGDLLLEIDPRDFITARDQAAAALAVARAQAENARINLEMVEVRGPAHLAAAKARLAGDLANIRILALLFALLIPLVFLLKKSTAGGPAPPVH
jgi:multidrug resistance efflux pump